MVFNVPVRLVVGHINRNNPRIYAKVDPVAKVILLSTTTPPEKVEWALSEARKVITQFHAEAFGLLRLDESLSA